MVALSTPTPGNNLPITPLKGPTTGGVPATTSSKSKKATSTTTKKKKKPTARKKKPTSTKKSAASAASAAQRAKDQYKELLARKAALSQDVIWNHSQPLPNPYLPPTEAPSYLEEEVFMVQRALHANGIKNTSQITAQAFGALIEHGRLYALNLISDAGDYAQHYGSQVPSSDDLLLARDLAKDDLQQQAMTRDALSEVAERTNREVLPCIPDHSYGGVVLPPLEHTLLGRTFDVVSEISAPNTSLNAPAGGSKVGESEGKKGSLNSINGNNVQNSLKGKNIDETVGSYGARRDRERQIDVKLKTREAADIKNVSSMDTS
jgi:histone H3/H4